MLMRFDPFRELDRLTQDLASTRQAAVPATMAMDAYRRGEEFLVHFDLPGVDPGAVDLTVEKNVLTVTAEREVERAEGDEWVVAERPNGRFSRQLFLGEGLDPERIEASYDRGVLTVRIPVAEQAKPRKVQVSSGDAGRTAIDTSTTGS